MRFSQTQIFYFTPINDSQKLLNLPSVFLAVSGLLLLFICSTKRDKLYLSDDTGTGGILLKSNTEAPGEEVVRKTPPFKWLN